MRLSSVFTCGVPKMAMILVLCLGAWPLRAQTLVNVPFPPQQQWVTDCRIPTVIHFGTETITLRGGRFQNVGNAVMYTSTDGCVTSDYPPYSVTVTFSTPPDHFQINTFNYSNDVQYFGAWLLGPGSQTIGGASNVIYPQQTWGISDVGWGVPVEFVGFINASLPWAWGITSIKLPPSAPDVVVFDFANGSAGDDGKILLSRASWDANYLSQYQVRSSTPPQVRITGTLLDGQTKQPKAGIVYLQLDDPRDSASYRGGDAHPGDNTDPAGAEIMGTTSGVAAVQADASGHFEGILTIHSRVAGDNFQVTGAPNSQFSCGGPCPTSGVFTLWKRVYVEEEHMFRQGSFLRGQAQAGGTVIPIDDPAPFTALAPGAVLELVHAGQGGGFYFDFVTFRALQQNANGTWTISTSDHIPRDYGDPSSASPAGAVMSVLRDGVGVVAAGSYTPNTAYAQRLYQTMFVDLRPADSIVEEVPFVREITLSNGLFFAAHWFQHGTSSANGFTKQAEANVFHRIGITQLPLAQGSRGCYGPELGVTAVGGGSNFSLIAEQRIADLVNAPAWDPICQTQVGTEYLGAPAFAVSGEVTAHETTHFWVHTQRTPSMDQQGHCVQQRFQHDGLECLMHTPYAGPGLYDGAVFLHYEAGGADSEYMWVRRELDPVPQQ